jgi:hypothetical protein
MVFKSLMVVPKISLSAPPLQLISSLEDNLEFIGVRFHYTTSLSVE